MREFLMEFIRAEVAKLIVESTYEASKQHNQRPVQFNILRLYSKLIADLLPSAWRIGSNVSMWKSEDETRARDRYFDPYTHFLAYGLMLKTMRTTGIGKFQFARN
jgi:hypothetical protein